MGELVAALPPKERTKALTEAMLRRKEERCRGSRCPRCWFPVNSSGTNYCVCAKMPPLPFRTRTRFLIYMHPRDWYNAGDDAKILLSAAPEATDIFVFGRPGDDDRLRAVLEHSHCSVLLFPDQSAVTVDEFLRASGNPSLHRRASGDATMTIIVIDGTWNNVKQMMKHFSREVSPRTPHVKLSDHVVG